MSVVLYGLWITKPWPAMFIAEQIRTRVGAGMVGIVRKMQRPEEGKRWDGGYITGIGSEHGGVRQYVGITCTEFECWIIIRLCAIYV